MKLTKTGGRKAGTPNKKTNDVIELINKQYPGFNPVLSMIKISQDENVDVNIRVSCLKEVSNYMFPKRKAIEVDSNIKHEINNKQEISPALKQRIDQLLK